MNDLTRRKRRLWWAIEDIKHLVERLNECDNFDRNDWDFMIECFNLAVGDLELARRRVSEDEN